MWSIMIVFIYKVLNIDLANNLKNSKNLVLKALSAGFGNLALRINQHKTMS